MIFGPKTLQNCFKDPEMHILSESIGLYPKMKSKWCYLEHFYEISGIFRPKIAFSRQNYKNSHFLIFLTFFAGLKTQKCIFYQNPLVYTQKLSQNGAI